MFEYFKLKKMKLSYQVLILDKIHNIFEKFTNDEEIQSYIDLLKKISNISDGELTDAIVKELVGKIKDE